MDFEQLITEEGYFSTAILVGLPRFSQSAFRVRFLGDAFGIAPALPSDGGALRRRDTRGAGMAI